MSSFKSFFDSVLGTYVPQVYQFNGDSIIPEGFAGVDWPYVVRAASLLLVIWCVLRIIGGLICR